MLIRLLAHGLGLAAGLAILHVALLGRRPRAVVTFVAAASASTAVVVTSALGALVVRQLPRSALAWAWWPAVVLGGFAAGLVVSAAWMGATWGMAEWLGRRVPARLRAPARTRAADSGRDVAAGGDASATADVPVPAVPARPAATPRAPRLRRWPFGGAKPAATGAGADARREPPARPAPQAVPRAPSKGAAPPAWSGPRPPGPSKGPPPPGPRKPR